MQMVGYLVPLISGSGELGIASITTKTLEIVRARRYTEVNKDWNGDWRR